MDDHAGSNEQQNDIMDKSVPDKTEQQYASMGNGNTSKSSAESTSQQLMKMLEVITRVMIKTKKGFENYVRML